MTSRHTRYQALIRRDDDAILLLRCVFNDGRDWWMLPGGGREDGETELECIVREVREETNLDVRAERLLIDQAAHPPDDTYVRWRTYLCTVTGGNPAPGGGEGANANIVDVLWLPLFDECAWPANIRGDAYLCPQLRAFRAALMRPVRAVLFDLDDTLLDRRASLDPFFAAHAQRFGLSPERARAYRTRFEDLDGAGYTRRAIVFGQLNEEFPNCGAPDELVDEWRRRAWDTCVHMDGAADILAWCRRAGFRTAIVTNGRAEMQRPKLEKLGLVPMVDHVLVSGEEGLSKPDVELFLRAAERLGVPPADCVFVGDSPRNDVGGALAAGMQAIWCERDLEWPADSPRPPHSIVELRALRELLTPPDTESP